MTEPPAAQLKAWRDGALEVARMAGARADFYFNKRDTLKIEVKGAQDYVSLADKKTEELIVEELKQRFPDHAFYGEEGQKAEPAPGQPCWVIDPIDGTTNFLRGMPLYSVSIGLVVDNEPVVGVIFLPQQDEMFAAAKGLGATLDGKPIKASATSSLASAVVAVGSSSRTATRGVNGVRTALSEAGTEIRRIGSACIETAYVACGRLDGYFELHLNSWDVAAGLCIVREAGAHANEFDKKSDWLTAGNRFICGAPGVFDDLTRLIDANSL